ncbi:MAG: sialidase family protein, partial [Butyricicoccus pullicaecorum]|nr:sialidase family protein [Butyricicoccus pullicaecorum]
KIFYEDSELQMYNTSYLLQVYSDDDGETWHSGNIISGMVKRENSRYYITGPGSGLQIQNGKYEGRILIPIYYQGKSSTEVIYTDDGGKTWQHGEPIPSQLALHESALVEMPDGSLQIFVRNTTGSGGKLITARSYDGGETWTEVDSLFGDNGRGTNCQISAINYSKEVRSAKDGKEYPAVLLATTSSNARKNGHIYVGLVKPSGDGYAIDWEYDYTLTGQNELFAYSCMAELSNGKVGILYETSENNSWSTGLQQMYYKELTMDELTAHTFS